MTDVASDRRIVFAYFISLLQQVNFYSCLCLSILLWIYYQLLRLYNL